jgi:outer membrane protein OmpA-like peptidoglycan-associated protein
MCPGTPDGWSVKHNGCLVYQRVSTPGQLAGEGKIALNADIMFDTASAQISPRGQVIVARLATELKAAAPLAGYKRQIRLAGYTDLMGRWVQNLSLSQKRADAVRLLLIEEGVAPSSIRATGYASSDPVVQCPATGPRDARISCLAPNRRVEIEVKQIPAL